MEKQEALQIIKKAFELFKPIPAKNWITALRTDTESKCCALGHWDRVTSNNPNDYSWRNCSRDRFDETPKLRTATEALTGVSIVSVNNNWNGNPFPQKTPKGRVMACLRKILKDNAVPVGGCDI